MTLPQRHEPGTRFGSYEIVRWLGIGGMASVYEARHVVLGKRVALKLPHQHLVRDSVAAARFLREGRAAAAIQHPNVVEVFEVGMHDGSPYLVIELLKGIDLATSLRARGRLATSEAVDILLPTASAVAAAHAAGVVHRDLKPSNVFLAVDRRTGVRPKVVDFGISKVRGDELGTGLTKTDSFLGTLEYMAPEQAHSAKNASELSDQYALGVILYECVTGQKPFAGSSMYELLHAIVTAPCAAPRSLVEIDPCVEAIIVRAMSREPSHRFSSVRTFGWALLPYASESLRARWHEENCEVTTVSGLTGPTEEPGKAGADEAIVLGSDDALLGAATMLEEGALVRNEHPPNRRGPWVPILGALAAAVAAGAVASALRTKAPTDPRSAAALAEVAPATAIPPPELYLSVSRNASRNETTAPTGSTGEADAKSSALPRRPAHHESRAHDAPHGSTMDASSAAGIVSARPVSDDAPPPLAPPTAPPRVAAPPPVVERGFNGAPIVE